MRLPLFVQDACRDRRVMLAVSVSLLVLLPPGFSANAQGGGPPLLMDFVQQGLSRDEIFLAECLQGLANRESPRVYFTTYDSNAPNPVISQVWLEYLTGELGYSFEGVANFRELIRRGREMGVVAGLVRYSSSTLGGAEVPVAMTLASQANALPVTDQILAYLSPGLKDKGSDLCFEGLPVVHDIRGRWPTALEARQWQVDNLLSGSSRRELFCDGGHWFGPVIGAGCCESGFCGRDYAVKCNAFSFDFPFSDAEYGDLFDAVMAWPDQPAPVFGIWPAYGGGESESSSTELLSVAGNYWIVTHTVMNMSFLSGIPVDSADLYLRRQSGGRLLDPSKYYILFQTSEGDTVKKAWQLPGTAAWNDPDRGQYPVAWGVNPLLVERLPVYLRFLKTHAGPEDTFFAGPNGAGYTWLKFMSPANQTALGAVTEPYLRTTGLQLVDVWGLDAGSLNRYKLGAPSVQGFTGEYGPTNSLLSSGVPLSRCDAALHYGGAEMTGYPMEVIDRIQAVAAANPPPYFIIVYDGADRCLEYSKLCTAELGSQFEIVGVEEYLQLANQRWFPETSPAQFLQNPGWDPGTVNGSDTGRLWTCSSLSPTSRAYAINDLYNAGRIPVNNGSRGFLKVQVSGLVENDYQFAASEWVPASEGSLWEASVYGRPEFGELHGDQLALLRLVFGDSGGGTLRVETVTVLTSASPDRYHFASLSGTAPSGTAKVRMEVGVLNPTAGNPGGRTLFDDARLVGSGNAGAIGLGVSASTLYPGQTVTFSVSIPSHVNQGRAVWVKLAAGNPSILTFPEALDGEVTLYFPADSPGTKQLTGQLTGPGVVPVEVSGPNLTGVSGSIESILPELRIAGEEGQTLLSWPSAASAWRLWTSSDPGVSGGWIPVTDGLGQSGGNSTAVLPRDAGSQFFQLRYP